MHCHFENINDTLARHYRSTILVQKRPAKVSLVHLRIPFKQLLFCIFVST